MAALAAFNGKRITQVGTGLLLTAVARRGVCIKSAGASDIKFTFGFGVDIDEDVPFQHTALQGLGTCHTCLLIVCNQNLDRAVLDLRRFGYSHGERHAQSVIGAERSALCTKPFAVNPGFYRVFKEIVIYVSVLLGHHIHMALKHYGLKILVSGSGGHPHDNIAGLVGKSLYFMLRSPVEKELADYFLML